MIARFLISVELLAYRAAGINRAVPVQQRNEAYAYPSLQCQGSPVTSINQRNILITKQKYTEGIPYVISWNWVLQWSLYFRLVSTSGPGIEPYRLNKREPCSIATPILRQSNCLEGQK